MEFGAVALRYKLVVVVVVGDHFICIGYNKVCRKLSIILLNTTLC
jgi:hypothetical protein